MLIIQFESVNTISVNNMKKNVLSYENPKAQRQCCSFYSLPNLIPDTIVQQLPHF